MITDSIKLQIVTLLSSNLTTDEIDQIGKHFDPKFNSHLLSGQPFGITLRPEQAARTLLETFQKRNMLDNVVSYIIHLHVHNDTSLLRKPFQLNGMDALLQNLSRSGLKFDGTTSSLVAVSSEEEKDSWGYLHEGELYHFAFLSVDIAGNSQIQIKYPKTEIEKVYGDMYKMINSVVRKNNGKIWNWAGDGGIVAFYVDGKQREAVLCALQIHLNMVLFNLRAEKNRFEEPIRIRIAGHDGLTVYKENKGTILSEAINYVAHLEKGGTAPGSISISRSMYDALDPRMKSVFSPAGVFENIETFNLNLSYDWLK